jgi:PEP-CTERM motif
MQGSLKAVAVLALVAIAALAGLPAPAFAVPLTLTSPAPPAQQFQQQENSPCVFGDPSCKQPSGFGFTSIAGGGSLQNFGVPTPVQSPTYTGAQILSAIGSLGFIVGIDVNQAQQLSPTLTYFAEFINGVEVATFGSPGAVTGSALVLTNNGNGFADAILSGFVAPASGDNVFFRLSYTNANDGTEEFFLINTAAPPPVVPEPSTMLLLGAGLVSVGVWARRRVQR